MRIVKALCTVRGFAELIAWLSRVLGARFAPAGYVLKQVNHVVTGADIAWQAQIGSGLRLYHPTGVVIGPYAVIGRDCVLQQGVTIGGLGAADGSPDDSPVIGDGVSIGAGAKIIGSVHLGDGAVVGANAVVTRDVPAGYVAVGIPAIARPRD